MEPVRVLKAVLRGRWWILFAATVGVVVGVSVAKFALHHTYEASASLRFEGLDPLDGSDANAVRDLPSQMELLRRPAVMTRIRAALDLPVPIDAIQNFFRNEQEAETGLVSITAMGASPEEAANIANTVVDAFLEQCIEARSEAIGESIAALEERIAGAQDELDAARSRYNSFRTEHGITDLPTEQEAALENAADLRAQADLARAEIASLEARVTQLRADLRRTPRTAVLSASSTSPDREELARAEAHLQQLRSTLSADHPRVQAAERQARALRDRISSGHGSRIASSTTGASSAYESLAAALATAQADLEANRQRETQLRTLAGEATRRVEGFSEIEGDATALLADVNVKEELLTALRAQRARLENLQQNPESGFRVLARAQAPESAVPSKRKYYAAAGIPIACVLLVIVLVLLREFRRLNLHTAAEVAFWGNGAVVGSTIWPRDPNAAGDLVADMDDFVPEAKGSMLVVGATDADAPLAAELARQLGSDWSDATVVEMGGSTRNTEPDFHANLLPPNAGRGGGGGVTSAEFDAAPTVVSQGSAIELLGPPTLVSGSAGYGVLHGVARPSIPEERLTATAWDGAQSGQQLRRAARLADRVLVVAQAGKIRIPELTGLSTRLGRKTGVGYVVVGVSDDFADYPDRTGPVEEFWAATKE